VTMAVILHVITFDTCTVRHDSLKVQTVWVSWKSLSPYGMYQLQLGSCVLWWVYCCRVEYLREAFVVVHMMYRGLLQNCNKVNVGIEVFMCMKTLDVSCGTATPIPSQH